VTVLLSLATRFAGAGICLGLLFGSGLVAGNSSRAGEASPAKSDWDISIGAGIGYQPRFAIGEPYRLTPLPYVDISWRDRAFLSTEDGLGYNLVHRAGFNLGPFLDWSEGRREQASSRLSGFGDVKPSPQAGLFAEYAPSELLRVYARAKRSLVHRSGLVAEAGGELNLPIGKWLVVSSKASGSWADHAELQDFYGVDPAQSAASGLPTYRPHASAQDVAAEETVILLLRQHLALNGVLGYRHLLAQAAASPLVRQRGERNQISYGVILVYNF